MRRTGAITAALAASLALASAALAAPPRGTVELVGSLHDHSAYSDGWPGTRPADVFASSKKYGGDFMGISDHSDNMGIPLVFSEACYGQGRGGDGEVLAPQCALADQVNPLDSFRKWDATQEQADAASGAGFTAFRGFEWSSDRFGHINVFFSRNWTSAYTDGGFADMRTFWSWFTRSPDLLGGGDGIMTFNHPDAKKLSEGGFTAPGVNWEDFTYVPEADHRVVGIETFNDTKDYGSWYPHALDKGWHVGAVGAEDLGHRKPPLDNWGGPEWAKTVVLAKSRSAASIKQALLARRFYSIGPGTENKSLRLDFTVDRKWMGSRLDRKEGKALAIEASASDPSLVLELVTSGNKVVGTGTGTLSAERDASVGERWYFVRALRGSKPVGYSSPVWVSASSRR